MRFDLLDGLFQVLLLAIPFLAMGIPLPAFARDPAAIASKEGNVDPDVINAIPIFPEDKANPKLMQDWHFGRVLHSRYYCDPIRNHYAKHRCGDGTISFAQPDSDGFSGWNGRCGETALSNLVAMVGKNTRFAVEGVYRYADDWTPGSKPETLLNGLNAIMRAWRWDGLIQAAKQGEWRIRTVDDHPKGDYIGAMISGLAAAPLFKRITIDRSDAHMRGRRTKRPDTISFSPVLAVLTDPVGARSAHWVTVVDVEYASIPEKCRVVYNTYGYQVKLACKRFLEMARPDRSVFSTQPQTIIRFEPFKTKS